MTRADSPGLERDLASSGVRHEPEPSHGRIYYKRRYSHSATPTASRIAATDYYCSSNNAFQYLGFIKNPRGIN